MFRILLLVVLTFSHLAQSKQSLLDRQDLLLVELSTTMEDVMNERLEWNKKFHQSLIEDDDPNIQLLGYSETLNGFNVNELSDIANKINQMVTLESLSQKSLATIASICSYSKLQNLCNQELVFEKLFQSMPANAYIYLDSVNVALTDNNQDQIKTSIKDMAESKYIDTFMYSHAGYRQKLESYVSNNPFPKNLIELDKLGLTRSSSGCLIEEEKTVENMQDIMIFNLVVGKQLAEPIPAFRSLVEVCKTNSTLEEPCLKISELFINKNKSIITARVGYAMKIEILKQYGETKELKQAENDQSKYTSHYECLANIMNYGSSYMSHKGPKFSKIADPINRTFGEVAFFEKLAKLNYDYYSNLGNDNIKNPDSCSD